MTRRACRCLRLCAGLMVFLQTSTSVAQPLSPRSLQVDGKPGVWFPRDDADRLLDVVQRELPALRSTITAQGQLIDAQALALRTATTSLALQDDLMQVHLAYSSTVTAQALKLAEAQQEAQGFFHSPSFHFGLGVTATAIILGIAKLLFASGN